MELNKISKGQIIQFSKDKGLWNEINKYSPINQCNMTITKMHQFKNQLITTVFCNDFKRFIISMGESVNQDKINDCIEVIDNMSEVTIQDCCDTMSYYKDKQWDYLKDKSCELSIQYFCYQIYQNIDNMEVTEEDNV